MSIHTVEIKGDASTEIKELLAKLIAIADREKGLGGYVEGTSRSSLLPGLELILATRFGDTFDPIIRQQLQVTFPAGPFIAAMVVLPLRG